MRVIENSKKNSIGAYSYSKFFIFVEVYEETWQCTKRCNNALKIIESMFF